MVGAQEHRALRVLGVTHLAAGLRTMEEPDEEGDEENTQMEASSANLSKSLEYFEQLIESAKATNEALSMAQAYRSAAPRFVFMALIRLVSICWLLMLLSNPRLVCADCAGWTGCRDVMKVHQVLRNDPQALEAVRPFLLCLILSSCLPWPSSALTALLLLGGGAPQADSGQRDPEGRGAGGLLRCHAPRAERHQRRY